MTNNPIDWFEIYVQDLKRAQKFYESVLGLCLEQPDSKTSDLEMLTFPMSMEHGSSGALVKRSGFGSGGNSVLIYFQSVDCALEAGRIVSSGGRIQQEKMSIGQYGFIVLAVDTEGNMFGLHSKT